MALTSKPITTPTLVVPRTTTVADIKLILAPSNQLSIDVVTTDGKALGRIVAGKFSTGK